MGLPKVQTLPGEFRDGYLTEEMAPPPPTLTFSTLDLTVDRRNDDDDEYDFLPLVEMEIGMVTEVTTTTEDDGKHGCYHGYVQVVEDYNSTVDSRDSVTTGSYPHRGNNPHSSDGGSVYVSSIREEVIGSDVAYDLNRNFFLEAVDRTSDNDDNDDNIDNDGNGTIPGLDNDFIVSWLSSLNEATMTTVDATDLDIVADDLYIVADDLDIVADDRAATLNDRTPIAKEELRSFLLTRKNTKNTDLANRRGGLDQRHDLHPRSGSVTNLLRRYDADYDSCDIQRLHRRQERNRIAAQKCRQKRTKLTDELSDESEKLRRQNDELTSEVRDLMKELRMLQNVLLDHDLHSLNSSPQCSERLSTGIFSSERQLPTDLL